MSTLKVDAIRHNSATSDAITTAADGTCTAKLTSVGGGALSHRNVIINGDMRVAQRGVSTTSNGYGFVDRFQTSLGSLSTGGNVTRSQESLSSSDTGPWQAGFRKYARMATVAAGTANANAYIEIYTHLEAQDIANSGWDYVSASGKITISFWFRCSTNQTFYAYLRSRDGTSQAYAFSFTASGNNTWTKITHTIPGNSNLTFSDNNGTGLSLYWIPFFGTDYTNNKTLNTWAAYDQNNQIPDMASTWLTSGAATWDITGVQLEVGDTATTFEHRSYGEELSRCQRYFYRVADGASKTLGLGVNYTSSVMYCAIPFPVTMRTTPTLSSASGTNYYEFIRNGAADWFNSLSLGNRTTNNIGELFNSSEISGTVGHGGFVRTDNSAVFVDFVAEL